MHVVKYYSKETNEVVIELDNNDRILLELWNDKQIRVRYTRNDLFSSSIGDMITGIPKEGTGFHITEDYESIYITTDKIKLLIKKSTAAFSWYDLKGELLVKEPERGGKWLQETDIEEFIFDDKEDGEMSSKKKFLRKAYSMKQEFMFSEGEAIYGLGQHEDGILNYRGHSQTLYQHNRKLPMPIIISSRGYACFFNTYSFSAFHDDGHGSYFWSEYVDELDYFFTAI